MKRIFILLIALIPIGALHGQSYTLEDLEVKFIESNSSLIARRFNIDKSEAEIIQERVWQNPTFSISEVNLWKNSTIEELPNILGKYGKYQQVSMELEQMIETAGKRRKRILLKKLEKNTAIYEYEEVLRELKKDLRLAFYTLNRIKKEEVQLDNMLGLFTQMNDQYKRQSELNNIRKVDYYRIQTELIGLQKEKRELEEEKHESLKELRILASEPNLSIDQLIFSDLNITKSVNLPYDLIAIAKTQNIGLLLQENEIQIAKGQLDLEKAERVPNVAVQVAYDRGGNIMQNFVGLGASIDIPVFNKNKGNIAAAKHEVNQQLAQRSEQEIRLEQSIRQLENQFRKLEITLKSWSEKDLKEQDTMVKNYSKHLLNKEVTLMEFIDFVQSYREAYQAYLETQEKYQSVLEELKYIVGKDF